MPRGRTNQRTYRCSARHAHSPTITADLLEQHVLASVRPIIDGLVAEDAGDPTGEIESAENAVTEATAELEAFAGDLTLRRALGDVAYRKHSNARVKAVSDAESAYRALQRTAEGRERIKATEHIDVTHLGGLLGSLGYVVVVMPGRGKVEDRVSFVADDEAAAN